VTVADVFTLWFALSGAVCFLVFWAAYWYL
jgi:hypothetical protein